MASIQVEVMNTSTDYRRTVYEARAGLFKMPRVVRSNIKGNMGCLGCMYVLCMKLP